MQKNVAQTPEILPLTMDGIFKMYFERKGNLPQLRKFLKTYLDLSNEDLQEITILNPGLQKANPNNKGFTVDLYLKTKVGNDIHIEMQTSDHINFEERVQLYNARIAGAQLLVGEDYGEVKRTISLVITKYRIFKDDGPAHEKIFMRRENGEIFTHIQEINVVDLTKLEIETDEEKQQWSRLFTARTKEELHMLGNESEEMLEATEKLLELSGDEQARWYALSRELSEFKQRVYEHDMKKEAQAKGHAEGHAKGHAKGHAEGRTEERIEIAKKLLNSGISLETIVEVTDLSLEIVESLDHFRD